MTDRPATVPGPKSPGGYSLIEVLIAAGVLAAAIAAASILATSLLSFEQASAKVARAINYQEQAGRLYQLGLDPGTITSILPQESGVVSFSFITNTSVVLPNIGTVEIGVMRLVYNAGSLFGSTTANRTNEVTVVRPSTR
jgi:type II secretory pathway pseudopilin PulG